MANAVDYRIKKRNSDLPLEVYNPINNVTATVPSALAADANGEIVYRMEGIPAGTYTNVTFEVRLQGSNPLIVDRKTIASITIEGPTPPAGDTTYTAFDGSEQNLDNYEVTVI